MPDNKQKTHDLPIIFKAVKEINQYFLLSFVVAVTYLVLYHFWFINIPEIFNGAYEIGTFVFPFVLAYATSFIFYFITVQYPKTQKASDIELVVYSSAGVIIEYAKTVAKALALSYNTNFTNSLPTEAEISRLREISISTPQNWNVIRLGAIKSLNGEINSILNNYDLFPHLGFLVLHLSKCSFLRDTYGPIIQTQIERSNPACMEINLDELNLYFLFINQIDEYCKLKSQYYRDEF